MISQCDRLASSAAVLALTAIVVAGCTGSATAEISHELPRNGRMSRLMLDRQYHEVEDQSEAAARLRCDAMSQGFDLQERPDWILPPLARDNADSVTIEAGCKFQQFSIADRNYLEKLTFGPLGPDSNLVVTSFVHLVCAPSIGQVADLLESGTRILWWLADGFLVVAGSECSLRDLARTSLVDWIQPGTPDLKREEYPSGNIPGCYLVVTYFPARDSFVNDLRRLGLDVQHWSRNDRAAPARDRVNAVDFISARGTRQAADAAAGLWWVRCVADEPVMKELD